MKISEYPQIATASAEDIMVISGIAGDRKITVGNMLIHRPEPEGSIARNITLTVEGWSPTTLRQNVSVPGMLPNTVYMWDVAFHTTRDEYLRFVRGGIRPVSQIAEQLTFQAFFYVPDIPINLIIWLLG